jgi:hypothetical protein
MDRDRENSAGITRSLTCNIQFNRENNSQPQGVLWLGQRGQTVAGLRQRETLSQVPTFILWYLIKQSKKFTFF